ncbi:MAG TPA: MerR family DNA-binding transcriptional regulator [Casimicrobium huifangae]|mgnify:CR=1 FL=1|jgi:DNA-binding transcriptional MerR regulator|uniref:MerR family transcriptional regulator n=1 Tax=Casimicrobium huifangae TaxID=2591109 RepID=UPI0012EB4F7D|nr:MerR family DNA-binding transcriptional regulator [Casimicrobium huifangae]HOB00537.1 MerR family DNA-binding transcriptional regulator [Casimicrobium huifangae]HQA34039.1 MerR family DNA-binding transcriptional regulator [Casimicrobium huifangae]HQD65213.1 MerR family DNA-binding transcriptional regulator [Casimicrobium huifangae]
MPEPIATAPGAPATARRETFTITELADEFALTTRAIRFYEDQGLLAPERRGTRRLYTPRERVRLKLILRGKRLGMSLAEIAEILDLYKADNSERSQLEKFLEVLARRRDMLEQQREDIDVVLAEISAIERDCRKRLKAAQ